MSGPQTRGEWVDDQLRRAIVTGELAPGEKLVASRLATRWSVSPTPLRESFQRLAAEGLVQLTPQRGARVAPASLAEALEIYELRAVLDPWALRLSMDHRDEHWAAAARQSYARLRESLEAGLPDLVEFEERHAAFHGALVSRCPSGWLLRLLRMLAEHSRRYRLLSLAPRGGPSEVLEEHTQLLESCLAGEVDTAVEHLRDHVLLTVDSLTALGDEAFSSPTSPDGGPVRPEREVTP